MQALYILGSGSQYHNNELRFSLRTLQQYAKGITEVVVVGEDPKFLSPKVTYHYIPEAEGNKEFRIASKIITAIKMGAVKGDFLFLNDDFFFTDTFKATEYPYYHKGCLSKSSLHSSYGAALSSTFHYLKQKGLPTLHFDIHVPIIYNTKTFLSLQEAWDYSKLTQNGLVVKSVYANSIKIKPIKTTDCKLKKLKEYDDFLKIFNPNKVFSCYDMGWVNGIEDYLERAFPTKSRYEL